MVILGFQSLAISAYDFALCGDSEFAFTCLQTDLFIVPPVPSTAPLSWDVAKKFQIKLIENSFSYLYKLENKYHCLNFELGPSLNMLISLIDEYAFTR